MSLVILLHSDLKNSIEALDGASESSKWQARAFRNISITFKSKFDNCDLDKMKEDL